MVRAEILIDSLGQDRPCRGALLVRCGVTLISSLVMPHRRRISRNFDRPFVFIEAGIL